MPQVCKQSSFDVDEFTDEFAAAPECRHIGWRV